MHDAVVVPHDGDAWRTYPALGEPLVTRKAEAAPGGRCFWKIIQQCAAFDQHPPPGTRPATKACTVPVTGCNTAALAAARSIDYHQERARVVPTSSRRLCRWFVAGLLFTARKAKAYVVRVELDL